MCPKDGTTGTKLADLPEYTIDEVAKHTTAEAGYWIILDGLVYNVTPFLWDHPGGELILKGLAGTDATVPFRNFHPQHIWKKEPAKFLCGRVTASDRKKLKSSEMVADYIRIDREIRKEGLYDTNYWWYARLAAWVYSLLGLSFYLIRKGSSENDILQILLGGFFLGLFWQQCAFLGHDLGHNSVTHVRMNDWWLGMPVVVGFGMSVQWWKRSHNVHHVFSNSIDWDSDIQHLPFIALDERILKGFYSVYHGFSFKFGRVERFLVSWQHIIFYPVMMLARLNMHIQSYILLMQFSVTSYTRRPVEGLAMCMYWVWYIALLKQIPRWDWIAYTVLMAHAVVALIHIQITLSHFAMPFYEGTRYKPGDTEEWIRKQFDTTMDVDCSTWLDWFHGGLQFQLVHHMYCRVPRHNLRYVRDKYILPFAKKHNLNYQCYSWFHAIFNILLPRLKTQSTNASKIEFKNSFIYDMFHLNG